ncbi:MAG: alpha/beta fold hydrolase [Anaerolineales bacterium]|nr:alpha/beta fold hydrolase [Anaerolineales bacterium]
MDEATLTALREARDLIKAGKPQEARPILVELIRRDQDVEHAWYMLSFTLDEAQQQRYALEQVLRLNPENQKARARLASLSAAGESAGLAPVGAPPSPPPQERAEKGLEPGMESSAQKPAAKRAQRARSKPGRISPALLILAIVGLCVILASGLGLIYLLLGETLLGSAPAPAQSPVAQIEPSATPPPSETPTPLPSPTLTWTPTVTPWVYKPEFIPAACNFIVPRDTTVQCGYVSVPEKRDGRLSDTIRLAVAIYRNKSDQPASDPVLFLQGGPGGSAIQPLSTLYEGFIAPIVRERDFIVFDQRGMGLSEPSLECPELVTVYNRDLRQAITDAERVALYSQAFRACRDRLVLTGVNLEAYTSAENAADVRDLVAALGYQQVNLYGGSYGTRLALTVMRDHPEIVRSAVLDSVLPLEVKLYNEVTAKTDSALQALFAGCAADPACGAAYPNLGAVFFGLVQALDAQPVTVSADDLISRQTFEVKVNGTAFINAIYWGLYTSQFIPYMPRAIYDVSQGNYDYLSALLTLSTAPYQQISIGAFISINCHEQVYATTPEQLELDLAALPYLHAFGRSAVYGDADNLFAICNEWGAEPYAPGESAPLVSDIPTLIIAGEYDPATPPYFAEKLLGSLRNNYYVEIPGMGHGPSISASANCPAGIALAFIHNPYFPPDMTCAVEMGGPQFFIR